MLFFTVAVPMMHRRSLTHSIGEREEQNGTQTDDDTRIYFFRSRVKTTTAANYPPNETRREVPSRRELHHEAWKEANEGGDVGGGDNDYDDDRNIAAHFLSTQITGRGRDDLLL